MSQHPLIELANDREVRQASRFREAAAKLSGESLAVAYQQEVASAPRRHDAGKKYLVGHNTRLAGERRSGRDDEHLALALVDHTRKTAAGLDLPGDDAGSLRFLHSLIPLKSAQVDKALGDDDPNKGVGRIDVLAQGAENRLAMVKLKYVSPEAARCGTGDTPLRALLEGLAAAAAASANQAALQAELAEREGPVFVDEPPVLVILGSSRYWQLCRKREAQKGAAWIKELERLAREVEEEIGITVHYLAVALQGDPGWNYAEGSPVFEAAPQLLTSWESGAGRVKPKPRPRPKSIDPADIPVEADLSRPVRSYALTDSYEAGDRIDHPTLGNGIVQRSAGRGKIHVLFGEKKSLLVHERAPQSSALA